MARKLSGYAIERRLIIDMKNVYSIVCCGHKFPNQFFELVT